jgi:PTS system fructose-specific IIA component/PTS system nitrogen regulatory IIA component
MRMSDFVVREAIVPEVAASHKEGVIRELIESLRAADQLKVGDTEDVVRAVLKREQIASTGIGRGVAIPHAKHTVVERLVGTVGLSSGGVKFDSLDGEPVHIFVLLVSPQDRPGDHLRALENISRRLRDDEFCRRLRQCKTRDEVWRAIEQGDNEASG